MENEKVIELRYPVSALTKTRLEKRPHESISRLLLNAIEIEVDAVRGPRPIPSFSSLPLPSPPCARLPFSIEDDKSATDLGSRGGAT
jgi:hypothetical protein